MRLLLRYLAGCLPHRGIPVSVEQSIVSWTYNTAIGQRKEVFRLANFRTANNHKTFTSTTKFTRYGDVPTATVSRIVIEGYRHLLAYMLSARELLEFAMPLMKAVAADPLAADFLREGGIRS